MFNVLTIELTVKPLLTEAITKISRKKNFLLFIPNNYNI